MFYTLSQKYGWLMCNILIKDLIVSLSSRLYSTAQPTRLVTFPTKMYPNKSTQFEHPIATYVIRTAGVSGATISTMIDIQCYMVMDKL